MPRLRDPNAYTTKTGMSFAVVLEQPIRPRSRRRGDKSDGASFIDAGGSPASTAESRAQDIGMVSGETHERSPSESSVEEAEASNVRSSIDETDGRRGRSGREPLPKTGRRTRDSITKSEFRKLMAPCDALFLSPSDGFSSCNVKSSIGWWGQTMMAGLPSHDQPSWFRHRHQGPSPNRADLTGIGACGCMNALFMLPIVQ